MKKRIFPGMVLLLAALLAVSAKATQTAETTSLIFDPGIREAIRGAIEQSRKTIDVEVFKMTDRGVINDLAHAVKRGIEVRVILCPSQKSNQKTAQKLGAAGVLVRWYPLTRKNQIMHLKLGCFDGKVLYFGSPNWTYWGLTLHHEGVIKTGDAKLIEQMQVRFSQDWEKSQTVKNP